MKLPSLLAKALYKTKNINVSLFASYESCKFDSSSLKAFSKKSAELNRSAGKRASYQHIN